MESWRDVAKEFSWIRGPQFLVQRNGCGEASHRQAIHSSIRAARGRIRIASRDSEGTARMRALCEPKILSRSNRHHLAWITFLPRLITVWRSMGGAVSGYQSFDTNTWALGIE